MNYEPTTTASCEDEELDEYVKPSDYWEKYVEV